MAAVQEYVETATPESLSRALTPLASRLRAFRLARYASRGALGGIAVSIVAVICSHLNVLPDALPLEAVIPVSIILGVVVGAVPALLSRITSMDAARIAETRLGLKERLSSALEFEKDPAASGQAAVLFRLQHVDALGHARSLAPREALPFRATWEMKAVLGGFMLLLLALIVPNLPVFISPATRTERAIVRKEGDKLTVKARTIEKFAAAHQMPQTKRMAQDMQRLGEQMAARKMDKKQALIKYSQLTKQMQDVQKKLTENAGTGMGSKSLNRAGQQLAQSLQAAGANGAASKDPMTGNPATSSKAGTSGQKGSPGTGKSGEKAGQKPADHGLNIPGFNKANPSAGDPNKGNEGQPNPTDEIKKAAAAMQKGDASGLSDQLRKLAQRTQSGALTPEEQKQAQQDLQKLSDALKGTPMPETQKHSQAAADALKQGDKQKAADEMRKAADAADKEMQQQMDAQGMKKAQESLQKSQNEMAGASSPSDISNSSQSGEGESQSSGDSNGQGEGNSQEQQNADQRMHSGQGKGQGKGNNPGTEPGEEGGGSGAGNRAGHGGGKPGGGKIPKQKFSKFQGPVPHMLNPKFDPTRAARYTKVYLGKPGQGKEAGRLGKAIKVRPGAAPPGGAQSNVDYYNYVGDAKKAAEKSVDSENIPPAYRDQVRKYFNSITPDSGH